MVTVPDLYVNIAVSTSTHRQHHSNGSTYFFSPSPPLQKCSGHRRMYLKRVNHLKTCVLAGVLADLVAVERADLLVLSAGRVARFCLVAVFLLEVVRGAAAEADSSSMSRAGGLTTRLLLVVYGMMSQPFFSP
ncbi:MAG: hypothetical protein Q9157_007593 [Trypethelium eluteriae]